MAILKRQRADGTYEFVEFYGKFVRLEETFIAPSDNISTIMIQNSYSKTTDNISVFYEGAKITENYNFTVSSDSRYIVLTDWAINAGEKIDIEIFKNAVNVDNLTSGSQLEDLSIDKHKLSQILQDEIGSSVKSINGRLPDENGDIINVIKPQTPNTEPSYYPVGHSVFSLSFLSSDETLYGGAWIDELGIDKNIANSFRILVETTNTKIDSFSSYIIAQEISVFYLPSERHADELLGIYKRNKGSWLDNWNKVQTSYLFSDKSKIEQHLLDDETHTSKEEKDRWNAIVKTNSVEAVLNSGENVINVEHDSMVDIVSLEGKTIVNHVPLFDSGTWSFMANNGNSYNILRSNAINLTAISNTESVLAYINLNIKADIKYTFNCIHNGGVAVYDATTSAPIVAYSSEQNFSFTSTTGKIIIYLSNQAPSLQLGAFLFESISLVEGEEVLPFVANIKGITNPTIDVEGGSLIPSFFDSRWKYNGTSHYKIEGNRLVRTATDVHQSQNIYVKVKQNTNYTLNAIHNLDMAVLDADGKTYISEYTSNQELTFNTGNNSEIIIFFSNREIGAGIFTIENVMLNEGLTALPFEHYRESSMTALTTLHEGDKLYKDDNGQYRALRENREVVLDGSLSYSVQQNNIGNKNIQIIGFPHKPLSNYSHKMVKYNGLLLTQQPIESYATTPDRYVFKTDSYVTISISNTDSGWGDSYTPTADEIKAYFLGWRMRGNYDTSPYISGTKAWGSIESGAIENYTENIPTIQAPINSKWQPYRLIYKLATTVKETVDMVGSLTLNKGDNNITVNSGHIMREVIIPKTDSSDGGYYINAMTSSGLAALKNRTNLILNIRKNGQIDSSWVVIIRTASDNGNEYGLAYARSYLYESTAVYTVDYIPSQPYKVSAPTNPITIEYQSNLGSVVSKIVEDSSDIKSRTSDIERTMIRREEGLKWHKPVLLNGWLKYADDWYEHGYTKDSLGFVHIRGMIALGATAPTDGVTLFRLPVSFRPAKNIMIPTIGNEGVNGIIYVRQDGRVAVHGASDNTYLSLNGIVFKAEQ